MSQVISSSEKPFGIKSEIAVAFGFGLLFLILLVDIFTPSAYRVVSLYLFPAAIITLNAKSIRVVILALILATLFENYFFIRDYEFGYSPEKSDAVNFLIRFLAALLIIWLARSLRRSQLRVNLLANTDSLTGLWNRRWARTVIEQAIARLETRLEIFSVALIDVNDFKKINDIHGHLVGDQVLTKTANIFLKFSAEGVLFFRLGGDEFLIVAPKFGLLQMRELCGNIVQTVNQEMQESGYPVTLSIGMESFSEPPKSVSDILHQVDLEMYRYKTINKAFHKNT
jgi:diguanylate cyclase (GGDEF)-like protein